MTRARRLFVVSNIWFSPPRCSCACNTRSGTGKALTVEAIFAHGPLIGKPPDELTWSPDGKHLTYLDGGELMDVDPATGRTHVLVSRAKMASLWTAAPAQSGTATTASATAWPATSGRPTPRTCSSIPTAGCGSTTCTTAPE